MKFSDKNGPVSSWITQNREARDWTKAQLSRATGMHRTLIYKYESGSMIPPADKIALLEQAFATPIEIVSENERKCSSCGAVKNLTDFSKNKFCKSGRTRVCSECDRRGRKLRYEANKHKKKPGKITKKIKWFPPFKGYDLPDARL